MRLALLVLAAGAVWGVEKFAVESQGFQWEVHGWAPAGDGVRPLVVVLHGAGGDGLGYLQKNGWLRAAERHGFIVLAPNGLPARPREKASFLTNPRVWNAGNLRAGSPRARIDDVVFMGALLEEAGRRWKVGKVFVAGHSNGGAMSFTLAARMGKRLAGIAPVATVPHGEVGVVRPAVPTLYVVGKLDPLVPYEGGESELPWGKRRTEPVEGAMGKWARAMGCGGAVESRVMGKGFERRKYCEVFEVVVIEGQGHGWPGGGESGLRERRIGPSSKAFDATEEIWAYFRGLLGR